MSDPHVEWLLNATSREFYQWHRDRSKGDIVQSVCALIEHSRADRGERMLALESVEHRLGKALAELDALRITFHGTVQRLQQASAGWVGQLTELAALRNEVGAWRAYDVIRRADPPPHVLAAALEIARTLAINNVLREDVRETPTPGGA